VTEPPTPVNSDDLIYLVVSEVSVYIPGDERSRTNPGHGYPERTEQYKEVREFKTKGEVISYIQRYGDNVSVYEAKKMSIKKHTTIEVQ